MISFLIGTIFKRTKRFMDTSYIIPKRVTSWPARIVTSKCINVEAVAWGMEAFSCLQMSGKMSVF